MYVRYVKGKALQGGNQYWYFFSRRMQNRATASGYWDSEGDDELVTSGSNNVGIKKTLMFYAGEAPDGTKTSWVMHEYGLLHGFDGEVSSAASSSCSRRSSSRKQGPARGASIVAIINILSST